FVLLADLLELYDLTPLLRAVKVARARHHQVVLLCPWPPGMPVPHPEGLKPPDLPDPRRHGWLRTAVAQLDVSRYHRAFHTLRRTFARLGVPVYCAQIEESVRLVLERLERLRSVQRGRR